MKKTFIYRNLTSKCFSVKEEGKVKMHISSGVAVASFKVNAGGRKQVLEKGRKFVHAYVVAESFTAGVEEDTAGELREVTYNPLKNTSFVFRDTGEEVTGTHLVYMNYPKVYVIN